MKCFTCGMEMKKIYNDENNYPTCRACMYEFLVHYWDDEFIDGILKEIEQKFNRSYKKWSQWFYETHQTCDGPLHEIDWWVLKTELTEVDGNFYCLKCIDFMEGNK